MKMKRKEKIMKKKTKIISAALVGIAVIYCGVKIGIPIYQRNKFETVRKNVEALIPEKADMLFSEIEGVKNVKTTTDFRFEVNSGSKLDCYDCADNIKYEIYVDDNLDKLDEESQYEYLEKINIVAQSVYNDIINNDYPDYSDFKSDTSKMKFYDKWVNFYGNREVYVLIDNNEYECYQYATDSFAKNGKEIDLEKIRKEKEFKNGYKEEDIASPWVGEWENIVFEKNRITKIISKDGKQYLAAYFEKEDVPFAMAEYPENGNTITGFIKKDELGFDVDGDLVLLSDDELQFPYYDGGCYVFVRVGSGLRSSFINNNEEKKEPAIGMTAEEVRNSTWGEPKDINKTTFAWGTSEQWVYPNYKYIYLDNGIVTAIQE